MPLIDKGNIFLVHTMKVWVSVKVKLHSFLFSVVDGCDYLSSRRSDSVLKEKTPLSNKQ